MSAPIYTGEDEWADLAAAIVAARAAGEAEEAEEAPAYDMIGGYKIGPAGDYQEDEDEEAPAYDMIGGYKIGPAGDYQEDDEVMNPEECCDAEFFQWVPVKEPSRLNPLAPVFKPAASQ
jgi:hypothetical protein